MSQNPSNDLWSDLFMQPASSRYDFDNDFAAEMKSAWNNSKHCTSDEQVFRDRYGYKVSTGFDKGDVSMSSELDSVATVTTLDSSTGGDDDLTTKKKYERSQDCISSTGVQPAWSFYHIPMGSKFFVIKSYNMKNVCLAIRHQVWSSTKKGNNTLQETYRNLPRGSKIYLFFSINKSGRFYGIAEMASSLIENDPRCNIWETHTKSYRFPNLFQINWVCLKDVETKTLGHLRWRLNDKFGTVQNIGHCRDVESIPEPIGSMLLRIFLATNSSSSLVPEINSAGWQLP